MIVDINKDFLKNGLICPKNRKQIEFVCSSGSGLYILVSQVSPGKGTYYKRYKNDLGKTCHQKIGRTTEISLAEARDKLKHISAEIVLGGDPRKEAKARKAMITYSEFMEQHYLPYVETRKRSAKRDEQIYRIHIKERFGNTRLDRMTRKDIQQLHSDVFAQGYKPAMADHVARLIRHSLNLSVDWSMLEKNPASRIPLFNEDNRVENYLSDEQLANLMRKLQTDHNRPVCTILMFLLSTGARLQEALDAKWDQFDLERGSWRIPARGSKSKKLRAIPINETALGLLIANRNNGTDVCFPNPKTGKSFVTITRVWHRLRLELNIPRFRIHDLRSAFAKMACDSGSSLYHLQKLLGHADIRVTEQRYASLSLDVLKNSSKMVAEKIKAASGEN